MKTSAMTKTKCPECGKVFECASHAGRATPKPGDFSVCFQCGGLMVFADAVTVRAPTDQERRIATRDPRVAAMMQGIADRRGRH